MTLQGKVRPHDAASSQFDWTAADAYLFDIDGTLLNTRDAVHYFAFNNALRAVYGVDSTIDGVPVHGNTDLGIVRAVLQREGLPHAAEDPRLQELFAHMVAEVERNHADMRPEVCPSITVVAEYLHSRGKLLGVASGNLEPIGWMKIEKAGLRKYFQFGSYSGTRERRADIFLHGVAEARRRLGAQATVYIVGDTPADIIAAREAGVPVIAVATGIYSMEQLLEHQPELCVPCCTDLLHSLDESK